MVALLFARNSVALGVHLKPRPDVGKSVSVSRHVETHLCIKTPSGVVSRDEFLVEEYTDTARALSDSETTLMRTYDVAFRSVDGVVERRSYERKTLKITIGNDTVTITPTEGTIGPVDVVEISNTLLKKDDALSSLLSSVPGPDDSWPLPVAPVCSRLNLSCLTSSRGSGRLRSLYSRGSTVHEVIDDSFLLMIPSVSGIRFETFAPLHLNVTLAVPTSSSTDSSIQVEGILVGTGLIPPSVERLHVTMSYCEQDVQSTEFYSH